MAFTNGNGKLVWMALKAEDARLPKDLREAIDALATARARVEAAMVRAKPAPKGRRWMFSYRYGVSVALAEQTTSGGSTSYFD